MANIVRLLSLTIKNIKNVNEGKIIMPNSASNHPVMDKADVLGIYGQNGSGKTAVIDTMYYLQQVLLGFAIETDLVDYISEDSTEASVEAVYNIFIDTSVYEVTYKVIFVKEDRLAVISKEVLSCSRIEDDSRSKKTVFLEFNRNSAEIKPAVRVQEIIATNPENKTDLIVAKKMAEKSNCSYIFGESGREIFLQDYDNGFKEYSDIIRTLHEYAVRDLFVIRNLHSGVISAQLLLPMAFRIDETEGSSKGDLPVLLREPIVLPLEEKKILTRIISQINIVIGKIIPGLKITIREYGIQSLDNGEDGHKLELMSQREGQSEIPIRMESEGIVKIISILSALIQAYNQPSVCMVIDELDAGIFEFMLGELLDIFDEEGKGQLIFTSHNLRALEMLDTDKIMFSTTNPNNRYIKMKHIRSGHNFRKQYIKSLTLGGQDEVVYDETSSLKIARAFRKAGRSIGEC